MSYVSYSQGFVAGTLFGVLLSLISVALLLSINSKDIPAYLLKPKLNEVKDSVDDNSKDTESNITSQDKQIIQDVLMYLSSLDGTFNAMTKNPNSLGYFDSCYNQMKIESTSLSKYGVTNESTDSKLVSYYDDVCILSIR